MIFRTATYSMIHIYLSKPKLLLKIKRTQFLKAHIIYQSKVTCIKYFKRKAFLMKIKKACRLLLMNKNKSILNHSPLFKVLTHLIRFLIDFV